MSALPPKADMLSAQDLPGDRKKVTPREATLQLCAYDVEQQFGVCYRKETACKRGPNPTLVLTYRLPAARLMRRPKRNGLKSLARQSE